MNYFAVIGDIIDSKINNRYCPKTLETCLNI